MDEKLGRIIANDVRSGNLDTLCSRTQAMFCCEFATIGIGEYRLERISMFDRTAGGLAVVVFAVDVEME